MKKIFANEKLTNYENIDCYQKPIKEIDSGSMGKAFEMQVRLFLTNKIGIKNAVQTKKKTDLTYKGYKVEIKSGCGTLDGIEKNDFVIYSPTSTIDNARVFTTSTFLNILGCCGLIRSKRMSDYSTKTTIQSFKNSNKKMAKFYDMLNTYGETLESFKNVNKKATC